MPFWLSYIFDHVCERRSQQIDGNAYVNPLILRVGRAKWAQAGPGQEQPAAKISLFQSNAPDPKVSVNWSITF